MKHIKLYTSLLILAFCWSCSGLLDENPKTFISSGDFYKTQSDFDGALKGMYVYVRGIVNNKDESEVFADYNDRPESAEQTGDIWKNNPGANFWSLRGCWQSPYQIINNANALIVSLAKADLPADAKDKIEGEAKFLRAFAYFNLVQYFGDVPLRTEPVKSLAEIQIARSPQADVYKLILNDLLVAEAKLPESAPVAGRVNKYVAKALLAKVYLTTAGYPMKQTANYALAKTRALEVINSGKYALKAVYSDVFHQTGYTSESIWEVLFLPPLTGNNLCSVTAPTGNQTAVLMPTDAFINSFPVGDSRRSWGIKNGYTNAKGTMVIKRTYYNKFINNQFLEDEYTPSVMNASCGYTSPVLRLAEMYLIAAEAENEINGPTGAYQYVNEIRKRARMNPVSTTDVPDLTGLTKEQFREAVWMERKWELHLEGSAWFDLKRTQTFSKVQLARGASLVVPIGDYNYTWLIPDFEISNNNISQNPAYKN